MRQGLDKMSVLKAAADLADQEGVEQMFLAFLTKKLQIRTPSLYNHMQHFKNICWKNSPMLWPDENFCSVWHHRS
jgi:hypothetical protein